MKCLLFVEFHIHNREWGWLGLHNVMLMKYGERISMSNQSERNALCLQIIEMKSIFNELSWKGFAEGGETVWVASASLSSNTADVIPHWIRSNYKYARISMNNRSKRNSSRCELTRIVCDFSLLCFRQINSFCQNCTWHFAQSSLYWIFTHLWWRRQRKHVGRISKRSFYTRFLSRHRTMGIISVRQTGVKPFSTFSS